MTWWFASLFACAPSPADAAPPRARAFDVNPEELGRVPWTRGFDEALARGRSEGKAVVVLFDEVPGCSTVKAYGNGALSDPFVVDALETLFVPVFVQNNTDGPDRAVLQRYGEPAWNNPVVRVVDASGHDVVPRLTNDWSDGALLARLTEALVATGTSVPPWLDLVARERSARDTRTSTYATACFWSGEAHLGSAAGVLATRTGFQAGREVVEVTWDPRAVDAIALDAHAATGGYRPASAGSFRPSPDDDRWQIRRTAWATLDLTPAQAARVNADVGAGRDPTPWLAPHQRAALAAR